MGNENINNNNLVGGFAPKTNTNLWQSDIVKDIFGENDLNQGDRFTQVNPFIFLSKAQLAARQNVNKKLGGMWDNPDMC